MASRPVFLPDATGALVTARPVDFEWFPGFAAIQKRKSIESLHASAAEELNGGRLLEISTKSPTPLGIRLSAFNLLVESRDHSEPILLEAAFQGSKVFRNAGQFPHLYTTRSGREIKRFMNQLPEDHLTGFRFEGRDWELTPSTAFYDWLYLRALKAASDADSDLDGELTRYTGFTDIEFNPDRSINCQARSCALYVVLVKLGLLAEATADPESFVALLSHHNYGNTPVQGELL